MTTFKQESTDNVVNSFVNVWAKLMNQKLVRNPEAFTPVSDVLEIIRRSIIQDTCFDLNTHNRRHS